MRSMIFGLLIALLALATADAQTVNYKPPSTALEASHIFCTGPCTVNGFQVSTDGSGAGLLMVFDSNTVPGDGAVSACTSSGGYPCLVKWYVLSANQTIAVSWADQIVPLTQGLVLVCSSTNTNFFTKTANAHCVFGADVK